jgi:hypothetical protein
MWLVPISVTQQGAELVVISGILSPSAFEHGLGLVAVRGSVRCRNISVAIAAPSVELGLRARCGTVFQHPHGLPDRVYNLLNGGLSGSLLMVGSPSYGVVRLRVKYQTAAAITTASRRNHHHVAIPPADGAAASPAGDAGAVVWAKASEDESTSRIAPASEADRTLRMCSSLVSSQVSVGRSRRN